MDKRTRPEVVVVTGASAGVGRAVVREFASRGAQVGLLARGRDGLEAACREVEAAGSRALVREVDVANWEQVDAAAQAIEETLGPIDIWVNDAMVSVFAPVKEMQPDEYRRVTEVTYLGYVHGTLAALHRMLPRDRGVIVQVGSALAYRGIPLQSAYCAAKHAIEGFTDSLRAELLRDKSRVRVTEVHLPAVNTPQFDWVRAKLPGKPRPVAPVYQPEFVARQIYRAAHSRKRSVYVGVPTAAAIIANRMAPGLVDLYLAKTGFESQQRKEPIEPGRKDNLYSPVTGDHGAHGAFDGEAKPDGSVIDGSALALAPPALGAGVLSLVLGLRRLLPPKRNRIAAR